jgi:hypothetical protein
MALKMLDTFLRALESDSDETIDQAIRTFEQGSYIDTTAELKAILLQKGEGTLQ